MLEGPPPVVADPAALDGERRLATGAVAAAGVMVLHQVAYLLAHPDPVARAAAAHGHGYLGPLADVVVPLGLAVGVWLTACRAGRRLGGAITGAGPLALLQLGLFVGQETLERVLRGEGAGAVLAEPAFWVGVALAPVLAVFAHRLLVAGSRLANPTTPAPAAVGAPVRGVVLRLVPVGRPLPGVAVLTRARGPPLLPG